MYRKIRIRQGLPLKSMGGCEEVSLYPHSVVAPCLPGQDSGKPLIAPALPSSRRFPFARLYGVCTRKKVYLLFKDQKKVLSLIISFFAQMGVYEVQNLSVIRLIDLWCIHSAQLVQQNIKCDRWVSSSHRVNCKELYFKKVPSLIISFSGQNVG